MIMREVTASDAFAISTSSQPYEVLERAYFITRLPGAASADPYAGEDAPNGKPILSPEAAGDNLDRYEVNFTFGNYGALDDGVLTYGFWTFDEFLDSYYFELRDEDGEPLNDDAYYAEVEEAFAVFTAEQEELAALSLGLWSDLIDVKFERVDSAAEADITFGSVYMSPAAGAHAYYPQAEAIDEFYGTTGYGLTSGDVWINWLYPEDFTDVGPGDYGLFALTHELGHSLGLAHGGDYNASEDGAITYEDDAYFFQDSQQYTIMSYFPGSATGAGWVDWDTLTFRLASTPMVHDILAVQDVYGANMTTRAGDTVYGFNSTAGRDIFDFTINTDPVVTIYDAGGIDTLDLSGWRTDEIIDLNPGAFSSASDGATKKELIDIGFLPPDFTDAELQALFANYNAGPQGQMYDNIGIAYGTVIENAIAGRGDDYIIASDAMNVIDGGAGEDMVSYEASDGGVTVRLDHSRADWIERKLPDGLNAYAEGDALQHVEHLTGSDYGDILRGNNLENTLVGLAGDDQLWGDDGDDTLLGGSGDDQLLGEDGGDVLIGGAGDDELTGAQGNDVFLDGAGDDVMSGGAGRDIYYFLELGGTDRILDFRHVQDKIDLTGLDAVASTEAVEEFTWIGRSAFSGTAGELRSYQSAGSYYLAGDVDGNRDADFTVITTTRVILDDLILA